MHVGHARGDLLRGLQLDTHRHQAAIPLRLVSLNSHPIKRLTSLSLEKVNAGSAEGGWILTTRSRNSSRLVNLAKSVISASKPPPLSATPVQDGCNHMASLHNKAQITRGGGPFVGLAAPVEAEQVLVLARPHKHRRFLQELPPLLSGLRGRRIHPRPQLEDRLST